MITCHRASSTGISPAQSRSYHELRTQESGRFQPILKQAQ